MRPVRLTRAQQQALTRERLLAAAEQVLARHGYGGASIDLITAEAGYSKGNGAPPKRYSAAISFLGGVKTTGAKMAAFNDAARLSSETGA